MLSIIIPTLNEEKYLPLLLESIKNQSFNDYEIIVADYNSEDKTKEIAKNYGCKVIKGGLPPKARNEGAKIAKGNLFLFLDADVILPSDFFEKALKEFNQRNLDVATTSFSFKNSSKFLKLLSDLFYNYPVLLLEKILPHAFSLILIKKDLHHKINGFDEEVKLGEDHYYVRIANKKGRFGILRSVRFFDSTRRFEKEGWFKTYFKYILAEFYMLFFGPIKTDIFNYHFDYEKD